MTESTLRVNQEVLDFKSEYKAILNDNPVFCICIDHIANIFKGCYRERFFLQEFVQNKGILNFMNGEALLSSEWDFQVSQQGIELCDKLASRLKLAFTEYQIDCLRTLFSFVLFIWRHTSSLNAQRSYFSYTENIIERVLLVKQSLRERLTFEMNAFLPEWSYDFIPMIINHRYRFFQIKESLGELQKHAVKVPELLLFSSAEGLPFREITETLEMASSKLYAGLSNEMIICQGIYVLRGTTDTQLRVFENDPLLYDDAKNFASVLRIKQ